MISFLEKFAQNCKEHGDKTALVCGESRLTYAELDERSDEVAFYLHQQGIRKEQIVAILLERGTDTVVSAIGIWKAGAAFSCISDQYPEERVRTICEDCKVPLILDRGVMDRIRDTMKGKKVTLPRPSAEDAAMALYTSGSTGRPKGILHDHRSILGTVERQLNFTGLTEQDVFMSNCPFYFVAFILEIITPLYAGCTVHFLPERQHRDIRIIEEYMTEKAVTVTVLTVQLLKYFKKPGGSLRTVLTGSERLMNAKGEGYVLLNLYGSSETGGPAFAFQADRCYENTPIGQPEAGMNAYLLDGKGRPVAEGEDGELCLSGIFARGYINLPEQTARVFTSNPFAEEDGNAVLYHTGDIARRLPDGNLLYVDRKDWQVKINGQRVEPGEIEEALSSFPGIGAAAVKAFTKESGQKYLCAYYQSSCETGRSELKVFLQKKLPVYMVPEYFIRLDSFPLNMNGKLDRSRLMPPEVQEYNSYRPPVTNLEKTLCRGFAEVLKQKNIGLDSDFYLLGGDSLSAMELTAWLQDQGIRMNPDQLAKDSAPGVLAKRIEAEKDTADVREEVQSPITKEIDLRIVETDGANPDVQLLCRELFSFFDKVVASGHKEEYEKYNRFEELKYALVAYDGDRPVGCGCFSEFDSDSLEGKHFYVRPEYRGTVVTEKILDKATEMLKRMGYRRMVCASGPILKEAMALYRRLGYREIEPYGPFVGMEGCICMEYLIPNETGRKKDGSFSG